ncbi:MAG TPA: GTPase domain-containing protein, partial [Planctomycetaceae bacterium]|nr:GTPase domain-containing protein [Planctomycetaceae bacterium]
MGDDATTAAPANRAAAPADDDLRGTPFADCAAEVLRLAEAIERLEQKSGVLQMPPLAGREWYELLIRKLVPQLGDSPFLVAAVVGGTNIGKSVIFNHLAGCKASATSPLASGTKHPVCLIPPGFADRHSLSDIFQGFELHPWEAADAALEDHRENRLYWQENEHLPANLLVLDTPDIDSDAPVNWLRADYIRHCADVLIAVLTQQKYNDAAVKQFFRKAAAEDKAVIVVFNQCLLPEDEEYWPLWLGTFTRETGVAPVELYIAPNDRRSAEANRLPFYERSPEAGAKGPRDETPHDLRKELTQLHFAEIKVRALRGSLRQILDHSQGAPAYLEELRARSRDFEGAAELMTSQQLARIQNWPALPNRILVNEIRHWWRMQRQGWTRTIHETYNVLGDGLVWGFRWAKEKLNGPEPDPLENYRRQERDVMLAAIGDLYDGLTNLSRLGNELLRPRLANLLGGNERSQLINEVSRALDQVRLEEEIREPRTQQFVPQPAEIRESVVQVADGREHHVALLPAVALERVGLGPVELLLRPAEAPRHTVAQHVVGLVNGAGPALPLHPPPV